MGISIFFFKKGKLSQNFICQWGSPYIYQSVLNPTCDKARTSKQLHAKFNQLVLPFLLHWRCVFMSSQTILVFLTLVEMVEIALGKMFWRISFAIAPLDLLVKDVRARLVSLSKMYLCHCWLIMIWHPDWPWKSRLTKSDDHETGVRFC